MIWDVFISHASEDKELVARPLSEFLEKAGLKVWLDEAQIKLGDSLRQKIDEGLSYSNFGIIILSRNFIMKDWTQKEFNAFIAREDGGKKIILPIWHEISREEVTRFSPLLADRIAVSTSNGLEKVRDEILKVLKPDYDAQLIQNQNDKYRNDFYFDNSTIEQAISTIQTLFNPIVGKYLIPEKEMSIRDEWMGTNSEMLIKILYDLYVPIMAIKKMSYNLKRSLATFENNSRIKYAILGVIYKNLTNEDELAFTKPSIEYTPRVKDWRSKRKYNPQRYWWQGISDERLEEAERFFIKNSAQEPKFPTILPYHEFKKSYHVLYNGANKDKQALGLLANALFGFSPRERPVYTRLLISWYLLYKIYLTVDSYSTQIQNWSEVNKIVEETALTFENEFPNTFLFEPFDTTVKIMRTFVSSKLESDINLYLSKPKT